MAEDEDNPVASIEGGLKSDAFFREERKGEVLVERGREGRI